MNRTEQVERAALALAFLTIGIAGGIELVSAGQIGPAREVSAWAATICFIATAVAGMARVARHG